MCIQTDIEDLKEKGKIDSKCREKIAVWNRNQYLTRPESKNNLCPYYEELLNDLDKKLILNGINTLDELKRNCKERQICPYFLSRLGLMNANVIIYSYSYLLDPKISTLISNEISKDSIVVFDEAHNIDNVCLEAMSIHLNRTTLELALRNVVSIRNKIQSNFSHDKSLLLQEYNEMLQVKIISKCLSKVICKNSLKRNMKCFQIQF